MNMNNILTGIKEKNNLILLVLISVAAFLRFYDLGSQSLWYDEHFTWYVAQMESYKELLNFITTKDVHPPLYYSIQYLIVHYLGDSEFWLRLPSAISGVLSVFFMYILGKQFFNKETGLISAFFLTFFWYPIYFSHEARSYSVALLFLMIFIINYLMVLNRISQDKKPEPKNITGLIIFGILLSYTHYYGLLAVFLFGIFSFIINIRSVNRFFKVFTYFFIIFLAYLPWIKNLLVLTEISQLWMPVLTPLGFFSSIAYVFTNDKTIFLIIVPFYLFAGFVLLREIIKGQVEQQNIKFFNKNIFLILWLTVPYVIFMVKSWISTPSYTLKHFFVSLPAAYLILAYGITKIRIFKKSSYFIAFLITMIPFLYINFYLNNFWGHTPYREAMIYVDKHSSASSKNLLVVEGDFYIDLPVDYIKYYLRKSNKDYYTKALSDEKENVKEVVKTINNKNINHFWLISDRLFRQEHNFSILNKNFKIADSTSLPGLKLIKFKNK